MHENTSGSSRQHYLFALLMFMSGLLIILIFLMVRSQADDTTTTLGVTNTAPTVDSVHISGSAAVGDLATIGPADNVNTTTYVWGTFTDVNGCGEVTSTNSGGIKAFLYNSTSTEGGLVDVDYSCGSTNRQDCYLSASSSPTFGPLTSDYCTFDPAECTGGTDISGTYSCRFDLTYYATPAQTWTAKVWAIDRNASENATSSAAGTATATLAALQAIDLNGASFNYGSVAANANSAEQNVVVYNSGNSVTNFYYSGTDMACVLGSGAPAGTIPVASIHVTSTASVAYASMDALTTSPVADSKPVALARRTAGAASTQAVYSILNVPNSSGIAGTCTGTMTISAG